MAAITETVMEHSSVKLSSIYVSGANMRALSIFMPLWQTVKRSRSLSFSITAFRHHATLPTAQMS